MRINVLALLLVACLAPRPTGATDIAIAKRGQRLFFGDEALTGRIAGHSTDLPTSASRCANCHLAPGSRRPAGAPASRPAAFGPELTAKSLTQARNRRGGPPSRYDQKSLCKVLRTGIDPVHIVMPTAMPRYAASDLECAGLWGYLSRPAP